MQYNNCAGIHIVCKLQGGCTAVKQNVQLKFKEILK